MKAVVIMLLALILEGCSFIDPGVGMDKWLGRHSSDLVAAWGPPQQILDDGARGRVYVYITLEDIYGRTVPVYGAIDPALRSRYDQALFYRMFWVTRNGLIYRWAVRKQ